MREGSIKLTEHFHDLRPRVLRLPLPARGGGAPDGGRVVGDGRHVQAARGGPDTIHGHGPKREA